MNIWVVLPTYNEADNLRQLVNALYALDFSQLPAWEGSSKPRPYEDPGNGPREAPRLCVLVVDDNSPDGTGALAEEIARERPGKVHVVRRQGKLGLGTAYRLGFAAALDHGADVVVEMDADFSHSPHYLPAMVSMLGGCDLVVGSRWAPGGRIDQRWERWRYLLSKYANFYARAVTGLRVCDTTAGFKVFRAEALRRIPFHRIRSDGYAFQIEVAMESQRQGLRVAEFPIYFEERVRGRSKMSSRIILEAAWRVWQIRFRL